MFVVNELLQSTSSEDMIFRVLWIDENSILICLFDINSTKGFPKLERSSRILEMINNCELIRIKDDPYLKYIDEEKISPKNKKIRDRDWEIFGPYMSLENEPEIFQRSYRGKIVQKLSKEFGLSVPLIYDKLRRGWQRGKTINAFLPDYYKSGGKGKPKKLGIKKLGRPKKFKELIGEGINLDEGTKRVMRLYIEKYYLKSKKPELKKVYQKMIRECFEESYYYENGVRMSIVIPEGQRPSLVQFRDLYKKEFTQKESFIARNGIIKYKKDRRALLSTSTKEVWGPGSRYQIDASVIDVYLVSRFNRKWIVGKPIIYVVVDVFSRLIVGVYIGWEFPSWTGAMMAMVNVVTNKVEFCRDYGVIISENEWPSGRLPDALLGDRGEWISKNAGNLVKYFQMKIENAAPYRADWKGIVERFFRLIDERVKPLVPGHIDVDFRQRGGKDYRLDAKLDISQLTQIILECIKTYNNEHWMSYYDRDEMLIEDDIDPIPIKLWEWGIKHRSGKGKYFPEDIVKLHLLPSDEATITGKGILFKNGYYSCDKALKEDWFTEARASRTYKIPISFDHRNMNYIYLRSEDGRSYEKCFLLDKSTQNADKTFEEIENYIENESLNKALHNDSEFQSEVDLDTRIENIVLQATEQTDMVQDPKASKASRVKDIKPRQEIEREINRVAEAFDLGEKKSEGSVGKLISLHQEDSTEEKIEGIPEEDCFKPKISLLKKAKGKA